jgi:hypothetical protein
VLYISVSGNQVLPDARIFDLTGREVSEPVSLNGGRAEIDISSLAPGVYVIQVGGITRKVVVE